MNSQLKKEILQFLETDPDSKEVSTGAESDVGTIFVNAVREITEENPELAVLAKAIQGEDVAALGKRFSGCFAPNVSPAESA